MIKLLKSPTDKDLKITKSVNAIHEIASRIHKRSLVLFFTDMMEGIEDLSEIFLALQHLKFNRHEVILFHLSESKTEFDLDFPNKPHKFIDMETNEEISLNPIELKKEYQKKSEEFLRELKVKSLQHKIDLVEVDINTGIEQTLVAYLLKRQNMFWR